MTSPSAPVGPQRPRSVVVVVNSRVTSCELRCSSRPHVIQVTAGVVTEHLGLRDHGTADRRQPLAGGDGPAELDHAARSRSRRRRLSRIVVKRNRILTAVWRPARPICGDPRAETDYEQVRRFRQHPTNQPTTNQLTYQTNQPTKGCSRRGRSLGQGTILKRPPLSGRITSKCRRSRVSIRFVFIASARTTKDASVRPIC